MELKNVAEQLLDIIQNKFTAENKKWLQEKVVLIIENKSTKDLYLTYSLLTSKVKENEALELLDEVSEVQKYLREKDATLLEIARIYLLVAVLEVDKSFFEPKVANIIQVADKGELETFLKFLVLLPNPKKYKHVAVDALRTNIVSVFDAIALKNPYPGLYFSDEEWNQMYLKAAFLERDLSKINDIAIKANKELARIISDYAHERWAARREVDPHFWRPITKFLDDKLLKDMCILFNNENALVKKAASLCCFYSENKEAKELLSNYPKLLQLIKNKELSWETLKE